MIHNVLWSGGFDSTLMLLDLLSYYKDEQLDSKEDNLIQCISVIYDRTGPEKMKKKSKLEKL